jgi:hypothetical protein
MVSESRSSANFLSQIGFCAWSDDGKVAEKRLAYDVQAKRTVRELGKMQFAKSKKLRQVSNSAAI